MPPAMRLRPNWDRSRQQGLQVGRQQVLLHGRREGDQPQAGLHRGRPHDQVPRRVDQHPVAPALVHHPEFGPPGHPVLVCVKYKETAVNAEICVANFGPPGHPVLVCGKYKGLGFTYKETAVIAEICVAHGHRVWWLQCINLLC